MKKLVYGTLFLASVGIGFTSCEKEEIQNIVPKGNTMLNAKTDMLTFNNIEELNEELERVTKLTEDERRAYEAKKGYTSLETHAYQAYEKIDMEEVNSFAEIEQFVSDNSTSLALEPNQERELEFFPYYVDSRFAAVANKERLFAVGQTYFKVFQDGFASTDREHLADLKLIKSIYLSELAENDWLSVSIIKKQEANYDRSCNNATYRETSATNGKNRTKVVVETYSKSSGIVGVGIKGIIRPYKKSFGVWYYAKRTLIGRLKATSRWREDSSDPYSWLNINSSCSNYHSYKFSVEKFSSTSLGAIPAPRMQTINSYGDTPSTHTATISC